MLQGLLLQASLRQSFLPQPRGKRHVRPSHMLPSPPRPASTQARAGHSSTLLGAQAPVSWQTWLGVGCLSSTGCPPSQLSAAVRVHRSHAWLQAALSMGSLHCQITQFLSNETGAVIASLEAYWEETRVADVFTSLPRLSRK